ncbi:MAG: translation initiation factor IF-2 N-terminal domain-containing protein, partial [Eubacteriales bacterium]|nr:translation initiation factor IF-2 N-terminal domain-containing protein [Eubacteriales bacterium]
MPKMRVHEVAKQFNKTSKEVIAVLKQHGIDVQSHMSTITEENFDKIKNNLSGVKEQPKKAAPAPVEEKKAPQAPVANKENRERKPMEGRKEFNNNRDNNRDGQRN